MITKRYDLRREVGGSWTVFDVFTGLPLIDPENETMLAIGLSVEKAEKVLDLMNFADCMRRVS
ncbi:hypothetical protein CEJ86_32985 [Sinorhizobium meliloti]|uniref:Uncharacterized protein n=1 Tax=Rhizobium meliloti TaxID=382 RepID=A0A2J0YST7_RHIML|nr:hypothetical protein CEJ86_32985 [Sinorhizobium meliloti]